MWFPRMGSGGGGCGVVSLSRVALGDPTGGECGSGLGGSPARLPTPKRESRMGAGGRLPLVGEGWRVCGEPISHGTICFFSEIVYLLCDPIYVPGCAPRPSHRQLW